MNTPVWLDSSTPLPHPSTAQADGLLAAGGELSIARLTEAYSNGIFPWFSQNTPVLWWSLNPRMVLACARFSPSHSLRKKLRQLARREFDRDAPIQIRMNTAFAEVMAQCAAPRIGQDGTWICSQIQEAYLAWHLAGQVHSIETWQDNRLVAGLYGVSLGGVFCGESMFSRIDDGSKLALAYLVKFLMRNNVRLIDCQQQTEHLASMGAQPIPRSEFLLYLQTALRQPTPPWGTGQLLQSGELAPSPLKTP
ncbi:MAG: leucyl/phenylalanyl-tRNA--protein transferase [Paralcaligenes sp.]